MICSRFCPPIASLGRFLCRLYRDEREFSCKAVQLAGLNRLKRIAVLLCRRGHQTSFARQRVTIFVLVGVKTRNAVQDWEARRAS